jgi:hypothetical protein
MTVPSRVLIFTWAGFTTLEIFSVAMFVDPRGCACLERIPPTIVTFQTSVLELLGGWHGLQLPIFADTSSRVNTINAHYITFTTPWAIICFYLRFLFHLSLRCSLS